MPVRPVLRMGHPLLQQVAAPGQPGSFKEQECMDPEESQQPVAILPPPADQRVQRDVVLTSILRKRRRPLRKPAKSWLPDVLPVSPG